MAPLPPRACPLRVRVQTWFLLCRRKIVAAISPVLPFVIVLNTHTLTLLSLTAILLHRPTSSPSGDTDIDSRKTLFYSIGWAPLSFACFVFREAKKNSSNVKPKMAKIRRLQDLNLCSQREWHNLLSRGYSRAAMSSSATR